MTVIVISSFGVHECSYGNVISLDILNHAVGSHEPNELLISGREIRASAESHLEAGTPLLSALLWTSPSDRRPGRSLGFASRPGECLCVSLKGPCKAVHEYTCTGTAISAVSFQGLPCVYAQKRTGGFSSLWVT